MTDNEEAPKVKIPFVFDSLLQRTETPIQGVEPQNDDLAISGEMQALGRTFPFKMIIPQQDQKMLPYADMLWETEDDKIARGRAILGETICRGIHQRSLDMKEEGDEREPSGIALALIKDAMKSAVEQMLMEVLQGALEEYEADFTGDKEATVH